MGGNKPAADGKQSTSSQSSTRSKGSPSDLLIKQRVQFGSLSRMSNLINRLTRETANTGQLLSRKSLAVSLWTDICDVHHALLISTSADEQQVNTYFTEDEFSSFEDIYFQMLDTISEMLRYLENSNAAASSTPPLGSDTPSASNGSASASSLPRITLPTFSGDITQWESFSDLFTSMVVNVQHLSMVQKFQYLKSCLTDEASTVIQNMSISDNFTEAWRLVKERYSNKHLLIFTHTSQLLCLESVTSQRPQALRSLIDKTRAILASLKKLGEPVKEWSTIVVVLTVLRLDSNTRRDWELQVSNHNKFPSFEELEKFILKRIQSLTISEFKPIGFPSLSNCKQTPKTTVSSISKHNIQLSGPSIPKCLACDGTHTLLNCSVFKGFNPNERLKIVQKRRYCYNCLKSAHFPSRCIVKNNCEFCKRKHHSLLHEALQILSPEIESNVNIQSSKVDICKTTGVSANLSLNQCAINSVLLATACVRVTASPGRTMLLRALIDQGSERSFITEAAAQALQVSRKPFAASISGIGAQTTGRVRQCTRIKLMPQFAENPFLCIDALILRKLTSYVPTHLTNTNAWPHVQGLQLADNISNDRPISLILGADVYGTILCRGVRRCKNAPTAQKTIFGWILSGNVTAASEDQPSTSHVTSLHVISNLELHNDLDKFWTLEETPRNSFLTPDETLCETLFRDTTLRDSTGRYQVNLPFKQPPPIDLGTSYNIALKSYKRLERRLESDPQLAKEYALFLNEYLAMGHMIEYDASLDEQNCYIPHHPVIKESSTTTKVRVVFNASCLTSNGRSLNDNLHTGPKLQTDLFAILLRWRLHRYVCTADVTKMFRQIWINPEQTKYQLILWRPSITSDIRAFRLLTVTYGTVPAPYLALRVLRQLAEEGKNAYPLASRVLERNTYVDDVVFGSSTIQECLAIRDELITLMNSGGLPLRKWNSNSSELLTNLSTTICENAHSKAFQEDDTRKVLGLSWIPHYDSFQFTTFEKELTVFTKRTVLSYISKLFDPLGLVSPVIILAKVLMQTLWLLKLDWDSPLPSDKITSWKLFYQDLQLLNKLRIPRWVNFLHDDSLQIHGFCDASEKAYAAVVYLRVSRGNETFVQLLCSKTRVAPVKKFVSIPRLELCGAELLSRLIVWVLESLQLLNVPCILWSDSSVTLYWISGCPSRWKTFVAHRVSSIQERLPMSKWRHTPTEYNSADIASRGLSAQELSTSNLWWHGPSWLSHDERFWPANLSRLDNDIDLEERPLIASIATVEDWNLASRFSDWGKLIRVTSLVFRYLDILRHPEQRSNSLFTASWITKARNFWFRFIQMCCFSKDINLLMSNKPLPISSKLKSLDPYLDEHQVLRVGGRLQFALLPDAQRHPVILGDHPITRLIIRHTHLRIMHSGPMLTLRLLRENLWILGARTLVRGIISKCVNCARLKATLNSQKMAPLPAVRVTPSIPFENVGIDYAGPFLVRNIAGRGHKSHKSYLALFVCLSTKAVHLELVMDYTTSAFIAAFRRFSSRRGLPLQVFSDNGTNFHGADKDLQRMFKRALSDPNISATLATDGINWHFISPSSPHFGGIWESGIKSAKYHLRRAVGDHTLTVEEFSTLIS